MVRIVFLDIRPFLELTVFTVWSVYHDWLCQLNRVQHFFLSRHFARAHWVEISYFGCHFLDILQVYVLVFKHICLFHLSQAW